MVLTIIETKIGGVKVANNNTDFMHIISWIVLIAGVVLSFIIYKEYGTHTEVMEYFGLKETKINMIAVIDIIKINATSLSAFAIIQGLKIIADKK